MHWKWSSPFGRLHVHGGVVELYGRTEQRLQRRSEPRMDDGTCPRRRVELEIVECGELDGPGQLRVEVRVPPRASPRCLKAPLLDQSVEVLGQLVRLLGAEHSGDAEKPVLAVEVDRPLIRCHLGHPSIATNHPYWGPLIPSRSEEHTSELQSRPHLVCRL